MNTSFTRYIFFLSIFLFGCCSAAMTQRALDLKTGRFALIMDTLHLRNQDSIQYLFYTAGHVLTNVEKANLSATGIEVLYSLQQNVYWVRVKGEQPDGIKARLFDIQPAYKNAIAIDDRSPQQRLRLSIAPGLSVREIINWAALNQIRLIDTRAASFGLIDVEINTSDFQKVIQTPWISFIENIPRDEDLNFRMLPGERSWGLISPLFRGLNGEGMTIGIGDGGRIGFHQDLTNSLLDLASFGVSNHAMQVAGIVTGAGVLDPSFGFGYAPAADVLIRNHSDIIWDSPQYMEDFNLSLTNNSYSANPFDCAYIGDYNGTSAGLDAMLHDNPSLLHVFAAGNSGTITCSPYPFRFATIAGGYQSGKNVLTVGAINNNDANAAFSSRGPVDDGRLKPEVVAYGAGRYSTITGDVYDSNSGTSFSAPATMGMAALLYQRYRELHLDSMPDATLIKNLIANGADDLGLAGPDFTFGYGRINGVRSVEILETGRYDSVVVNHNSTIIKTFVVPEGISSIDVMLMWVDHPSAPYETVSLVNDLDLILIDPTGDTLKPWKLNYTPAGVSTGAITGVDHTNNSEQVTVASAEQGTYTIIVKGYDVPMGPQSAWLSWDLHATGITLQSPIGGEVFKPGNPAVGSDLQYIRWDAFGTGNSTFTAEYSIDGGIGWTTIASNIVSTRRFHSWFIPAVSTDKFRVRITASNGMQDTSDFDAIIMSPPSGFAVLSPCDGYVNASWNAVPGAAYYQLYAIRNEILVPLDTTSGLTKTLSGFTSDTEEWITVAGIFPSGKVGLRAPAKSILPAGGNLCSWNTDIRLDSLLNPVSGRQSTSSSLSSTEQIEIYISNAGQLNASGFTISYQVDNNPVVTELFAGTLNSGSGQSFLFSQTHNFSASGSYDIKVWTTFPADPFKRNDTLNFTIVHLANPVIALPWDEDFDTLPDTYITSSVIGMAGLDQWDAQLEDVARIRSFAGSPFSHSGTRALTMDAIHNISEASGDVLLTLNFSAYNVTDHDIRMSLFHMHHQLTSDTINPESIMVRGSDADTFILATLLSDESTERGMWQHLAGIQISDLLAAANQNYSSSFQVKFHFQASATAGELTSEDGQTIDDISFRIVPRDLTINEVIHPAAISCGLGMESIEVSITNTSDKNIPNALISYQLNDGSVHTTSIGMVPQFVTMNFVLSPAANFSDHGEYDLIVWVSSPTDDFYDNDTLRTVIIHSPLISTFPYREGFESGPAGWFEGGINSSWDHGSGGKQIISRAAEGEKIWTTSLTSSHNADEHSYLYSPCFDIQGLTQPFLSFAFQYQLETDYDYAWVEYRLQGSSDWIKLGTQGSGINWYNDNSHRWNGLQSKWITTGIPLPVTDTTLQFRWVMQSDEGVELEGLAIDQVNVYDNVAVYTGPSGQWTIPVAGNNWIHIDQNNQRIFSIHPQGQDLGNVTLSLYKSNQDFIIADSLYLLSRNWVVTSTIPPSSPILIRAYVTNPEANNLVNATGCNTCLSARDAFDVAAAKYSGANEDGLFNNNQTAGVQTFPSDSIYVFPYENGYYAEWTTTSFSEWWLSSPVTRTKGTLTRQISGSGDDAEEHENNGSVNPVRDVLALTDYNGHQRVGWRFRNISIPAGSYIASAYLTWTASDSLAGPASWILQSQMSTDAAAFTTNTYNLSLRPRSDQIVSMSPGTWDNDMQYSSPDIRHLIQSVIDQPLWSSGNDLVLLMKGSGIRETWSYDGDAWKGATLTITFDSSCIDNGIIYVDKNATGIQNGSSWANAYRTLGQALDRTMHCPGINQIWMADGDYAPYNEVPRVSYYNIRPGVSIYGGFQGWESSPNERIYGQNPTVISGEIGSPDIIVDNLYHVLVIQPGTGSVTLDGLTIEKGMANGVLPDQQTGGGIYNQGKLFLHQVIIKNNSAPAVYNAPGSELTATGILDIRQ